MVGQRWSGRRGIGLIVCFVLWSILLILVSCGANVPALDPEVGSASASTMEPELAAPILEPATSALEPEETTGYGAPQSLPTSRPPDIDYPPPAMGGSLTVRRLSSPLQSGGVVYARLSPDGERVVYLVLRSRKDANGLYSVPVVGGKPVKLADAQDLIDYVISADSQYVVYSPHSTRKVWGVPLAGGEPIELSAFLDDQGVESFLLSPDGRQVVMLAMFGEGGLYSLPVDGGKAIRLEDPLSFSGGYTISPDSQFVVYGFDNLGQGPNELRSIPITGGVPQSLGGTLASANPTYAFSPDGTRVVFQVNPHQKGGTGLFSIPVEGGFAVELTPPPRPDADLVDFRISPDSRYVLWRMRLRGTEEVEGYPSPRTFERSELYSVPITGGVPFKLNGQLIQGGSVENYAASPNGQDVVYSADQEVDDVAELYSVPIVGGTVRKLSQPRTVRSNRIYFRFSPNGAHIVYGSDHQVPDVDELYSVILDGTRTTQLGAGLKPGSVTLLDLSSDNSSMLYLATEPGTYGAQLWLQPLQDSEPVKLNAQLVQGGNVELAAFTPDLTHVIYVADQERDTVSELYVASLDLLP